jgi:hypothetical protein
MIYRYLENFIPGELVNIQRALEQALKKASVVATTDKGKA